MDITQRNATRYIAALLSLLIIPATKADSVEADAAKHVPSGAILARVPRWGSSIGSGAQAVAAVGPLTRPAAEDLAFVYEYSGGLVLRVAVSGHASTENLDAHLPGTYVQSARSIPGGIYLRDVAGRGTEQVFVLTAVGASLGAFLSIFSVDGTSLVNVVDGLRIEAYDFDLECEAGHSCRIIAYGKWVDRGTSSVWIYEWLGRAFIETDTDADRYFLSRLAKVAATASADLPMPPNARVRLSKQAVELFLDRRDYDSAIQLCQAALARLEDPTKNQRLSAELKVADPEADFQTRLLESKASLHQLLGQSYEAAGRPSDANIQYQLAQEIRGSLIGH